MWCQSVSKDVYGGLRGQVIGRLSRGNILYVYKGRGLEVVKLILPPLERAR